MPSVSLYPSQLTADADGVASGELRIRNASRSTRTFRPDVTGPAAAWVSFFPPSVAVGPGESAVVRLSVRVRPTSSTPVGAVDFTVVVRDDDAKRAVSVAGSIDAAARAVVVIRVGAATHPSPAACVQPLEISNRGNAPSRAAVTARGQGVALEVSPAQAELPPGAEITVVVTARAARRTWRSGSELPFSIDVEATGSAATRIDGSVVPRPLLTGRAGALAATGLALVLIAGLLRATVLAPAPEVQPAAATACPGAAHEPSLANALLFPPGPLTESSTAYTYYSLVDDGCVPRRFNPCEPVHYVLNAALAPPDGVADVRAAMAQIAAATGLRFVEEGMTDEPQDDLRPPFQPERYGDRWAPLLIGWYRRGDASNSRVVLGESRPYASGRVFVSGFVHLNADAYSDAETRRPLPGGFGPVVGARREMPIGARGVTWGRVLLHELTHMVGLAHVADSTQLMVSELTRHTNPRAELGSGDLSGLRALGRDAGCLSTPRPGAPGGYVPPVPP